MARPGSKSPLVMSSMPSRSRAWRKAGSRCARSRIVSRKSLVSAISLPPLLCVRLFFRSGFSGGFSCGGLPLLVLPPSRLGIFNVRVLALLGSTTEQDHQRIAVLSEVNAISGAPIEPVFGDSLTHWLKTGRIALGNAFHGGGHLDCSCNVQFVEPISVFVLASEILVFLDRDHFPLVVIITHMLSMSSSIDLEAVKYYQQLFARRFGRTPPENTGRLPDQSNLTLITYALLLQ